MVKGNILASKKGSVLPVTLIVIAVLTLAITLTTRLTLQTASNTQREVDKIHSRNSGEGLINESVLLMQSFINDNRSFPDGAYIDLVYQGTGLDAGYGSDNLVEVDDVSDEHSAEGYGDFGELRIHLYRFSFQLESGKTLVRYLHATTGDSSVDSYDPFSYNIGTNGDLIIGGGYYKDANFFADNMYISKIASFQNDILGTLDRTPASNSEFPVFEGETLVTLNGDISVCSDWTCFNRNDDINRKVKVYTDNYTDLITTLDTYPSIDDVNVVDYFGDWSFEDFIVDYVTQKGVSDNGESFTDANPATGAIDPITLENLGEAVANNTNSVRCIFFGWICIRNDNSYKDITGDRDEMFDFPLYSMYYGNDLLIDESLRIRYPEDLHDETALFVDGDLTIDMNGATGQRLSANIIVNGDLLITGNTFDIQGVLIVLGETIIDFDDGHGFTTDENNWWTSHGNGLLNFIYSWLGDPALIHDGYTFLSQDNIYINNYYSQNTGPKVDKDFGVFMYTEESIYIDGVNSNFHIDGSLYARAMGAIPANDMNIIMKPSNEQFRGIFISSYQGYINLAGTEVPYSGFESEEANGFITKINSVRSYEERFSVVPTWESLVFYTEGYASFFPDVFVVED